MLDTLHKWMLSLSQAYDPKFITFGILTIKPPLCQGLSVPYLNTNDKNIIANWVVSNPTSKSYTIACFSRPFPIWIVAVLFLQKANSEREFIVQVVYHEVLLGSTPMEEESRIEKWEKLSYEAGW